MSILIGQHEFDGPVVNLADVPPKPGLYAVLHKQNRDLFLLDIDQSDNMAHSLGKTTSKLDEKMVVLLACDSRDRRKIILHELLREFEFEDEAATQAAPARRTETKAGVARAI